MSTYVSPHVLSVKLKMYHVNIQSIATMLATRELSSESWGLSIVMVTFNY